jgi:hypothetical protein
MCTGWIDIIAYIDIKSLGVLDSEDVSIVAPGKDNGVQDVVTWAN